MSDTDQQPPTGDNEPEAEERPEGEERQEGEKKTEAQPRADLQHLDSPLFPHRVPGAEQAEMNKLVTWVEEYFVPTFVYEVRQDQPWCLQWAEHDDAIFWLHAVMRAFQSQINTESPAGMVGPSLWGHQHALPALRYLRDPQGPFKRCMRGPDKIDHQVPTPLPKP